MKKLALFAMLLGSSFFYGCGEEKKPAKPVDKPAVDKPADDAKPAADKPAADKPADDAKPAADAPK